MKPTPENLRKIAHDFQRDRELSNIVPAQRCVLVRNALWDAAYQIEKLEGRWSYRFWLWLRRIFS